MVRIHAVAVMLQSLSAATPMVCGKAVGLQALLFLPAWTDVAQVEEAEDLGPRAGDG